MRGFLARAGHGLGRPVVSFGYGPDTAIARYDIVSVQSAVLLVWLLSGVLPAPELWTRQSGAKLETGITTQESRRVLAAPVLRSTLPAGCTLTTAARQGVLAGSVGSPAVSCHLSRPGLVARLPRGPLG